jgi:hypothetical protein
MAKIGRFCQSRKCDSDEEDKALYLALYFDALHSNKGTIIVRFSNQLSTKSKQYVIVAYNVR